MDYKRMPIESEAPEFLEPDAILYNLTESSNANFKLDDLGPNAINLSNLLLAYGDHLGKKELRELIAKEAGVHPDEVLITTGASLALFIIGTALLKKGDRLVVEYPNYVINLETPRLLGAKVDNLTIKFEDGFKPTLADIEAALQTEAKMLSLSVPHNPVGSVISESDLKAIVELTEKKKTILLMDETYREMHFDNPLPIGASLGKHVISISSMSKTYGLPGIRIGWLICRDPALMEKFLAAKEQIVICGSVLDEEVAYQFLKRKEELLPKIKESILEKRQILFDWFKNQHEYMEWVEPQVGVVCFPRLKTTDPNKVDEFYKVLNMEFKTWVGPGHWFEMDRRYMRIGYGWPTKEELSKGLDCISQTLRKVFA